MRIETANCLLITTDYPNYDWTDLYARVRQIVSHTVTRATGHRQLLAKAEAAG